MDDTKKFEDFLDKMQGLLDNAKKQGHIIIRVEDLENAFTELKESEDERIRNELIGFIKKRDRSGCDYDYDKWITWLEKQGESDETKAKMFLINNGYPIDTNGIFPTYEEIYNIIKEGLEYQGKSAVEANNEVLLHVPAIEDTDKELYDMICGYLDDERAISQEEIDEFKKWLLSKVKKQ